MLRRGSLLLTLGLLLAPVSSAQDLTEELFTASRKGDAAAVKALLEKGVDANAMWRYDTTALFFAADRGHTEVVKVLLYRGAEVNVEDTFYGITPLNRAAGKGHVAVVKLLLEKGAAGKESALTAGVRQDNKELVRVVLEKGNLDPATLSSALYFTSEDGEGHVVKAGPKYELLATNRIGEVLMATPAISQGMVIVRGVQHVFSIGGALKKDGARVGVGLSRPFHGRRKSAPNPTPTASLAGASSLSGTRVGEPPNRVVLQPELGHSSAPLVLTVR